MKQIRFGRLVFDLPIMTTCRSGTKWFEDINVGEEFEICDVHGNPIGRRGQVLFQNFEPFHDIPRVWVEINHDPAARTPEGLKAAMDVAYPSGWDTCECTTLGFRLVG